MRSAAAALLAAALLAAAAGGAAAVPAPDMRGTAALRQAPAGSDAGGSDVSTGSSSSGSLGAFSGTQPSGIRLSLGEANGELVVRWSTRLPPGDAACVQLCPAPGADPSSSGLRGGAAGGRAAGCDSQKSSLRLQPTAAASTAAAEAAAAAAADVVQVVCGRSEPFAEPASGAVGQHLHTVVLSGLQPGRRYAYRCGSAAGGWSDWHAFRAPRSAEQFGPDAPARLLVVGDMGLYNARAWPALAADAASGAYDALLHVGDLAYDLYQPGRAAGFFSKVQPAAAALPYHALPGNHEWHFNFSHFSSLLAMPCRSGGQGLYHSFDLGPLHVLAYNTEVFFWPELFGPDHMRQQLEWMEADLQAANANRARVPWVLVAGHRPMYCVQATGGRCSAEQEAARLGLPSFCPHNNPAACRPLAPPGQGPAFPVEALLHKYGVDLAVFGHVHDYERYLPVFDHTVAWPHEDGTSSGGGGGEGSGSGGGGTISFHSSNSGGGGGSADAPPSAYINPRATVHVTSGAGGNSEMRGGEEPPPQGPCGGSAPWCAYQSGFGPRGGQSYDFSHSRLTVYNATHLRWQQYSSTFGRATDDWWLVQHAHGGWAA